MFTNLKFLDIFSKNNTPSNFVEINSFGGEDFRVDKWTGEKKKKKKEEKKKLAVIFAIFRTILEMERGAVKRQQSMWKCVKW
jgi:hypothetical protein